MELTGPEPWEDFLGTATNDPVDPEKLRLNGAMTGLLLKNLGTRWENRVQPNGVKVEVREKVVELEDSSSVEIRERKRAGHHTYEVVRHYLGEKTTWEWGVNDLEHQKWGRGYFTRQEVNGIDRELRHFTSGRQFTDLILKGLDIILIDSDGSVANG